MTSSDARRDLLLNVLDSKRVEAAAREQAALESFCDRLSVPVCVEALTLYLTWHSDLGERTRMLQRRLARLNLSARIQGSLPWSAEPSIRTYMRGMARQSAIGGETERGDPLYLELVHVLVQQVMAASLEQLRETAAIHLSAEAQVSAGELVRLKWTDVRWTKAGVAVEIPNKTAGRHRCVGRVVEIRARGGEHCPVAALRRLRERVSLEEKSLFGIAGTTTELKRYRRVVRSLELVEGEVEVAVLQVRQSPMQARDRAILVVGYGAALRTVEAVQLRVRDIVLKEEGLEISVPGRTHRVELPVDPGMLTDPYEAWDEWLSVLRRQGKADPEAPAFPRVNGPIVWRRPLGQLGLNSVVQRRAVQAGLEGTFTFTSLRYGMVRTAIRSNEHAYVVAMHSDLKVLQSLRRHVYRETLLSRSVAGQVGL